MKFYIVDDVRSVIKVLDRIIEQKNLGEVIGFSTDAEKAVREIIAKRPEVVLVDLLMPVKDGISIVNEVKQVRPEVNFIMISQVSDKGLVSEAYKAGVEFFIHKPINIIEVETIIQKVTEKLEMESMLGGIRKMMQAGGTQSILSAEPSKRDLLKEIKYLIGVLGMLGERGTKDILGICENCLRNNVGYESEAIVTYSKSIGEDEKIVKQRIRRAVKKGLSNAAHMGIEDYYNETFQEYSQMVFDFESLRTEMDYIRGTTDGGGKASIGKFIEGLLTYSDMKE